MAAAAAEFEGDKIAMIAAFGAISVHGEKIEGGERKTIEIVDWVTPWRSDDGVLVPKGDTFDLMKGA